MNIKPAPGYALLQMIREDIKSSESGLIVQLDSTKESAFFNRFKILAINAKKDDTFFKKDDIVIVSRHATAMFVPGRVQLEPDRWVDVQLLNIDMIIAVIEGDIAEDFMPGSKADISIVPANPHLH